MSYVIITGKEVKPKKVYGTTGKSTKFGKYVTPVEYATQEEATATQATLTGRFPKIANKMAVVPLEKVSTKGYKVIAKNVVQETVAFTPVYSKTSKKYFMAESDAKTYSATLEVKGVDKKIKKVEKLRSTLMKLQTKLTTLEQQLT